MKTVTRSIGTTTRSFIHRGADAAWTGSRAGSKPLWVAEQVLAACQGIEAPVIACLGLAYKAEVLSAAVPSPGGPTTRGVTYCLATKVTILTHVSPTVFREGPYRFFFFSREEARIHVHVICASGEAKFWLDPAVEPAMSKGISAHESRAIQRIIERVNSSLGLPSERSTHRSDPCERVERRR